MGLQRVKDRRAARREPLAYRQVFETWWIGVPFGFEETWVDEGSYWHAWDGHRSISMSSTRILQDDGQPVPAAELIAQLGEMLEGEPVVDLPPGLDARATTIVVEPPTRATRALTGYVVADGRALLTTITSDALDWAKSIWRTIGYRESAPAHPSASPRSRPGWDRAPHWRTADRLLD